MNRIKNFEDYLFHYQEADKNPNQYWSKVGKEFHWMKNFTNAFTQDSNEFKNVEWFADGVTNICYNALDRHVAKNPEKIAIYFEPNDISDARKRTYTYKELFQEVCRMAESLRALGVKKGETVTLYMSMTPNLLFSVLACARIGAIHSVVFGGFSANALSGRIQDADSNIIITQTSGKRGDKIIQLKNIVDEAIKLLPENNNRKVVVFDAEKLNPIDIDIKKFWLEKNITLNVLSPLEHMDSEDPLFILYTSGSTGKPKGLLHTTAGYMVWSQYTFEQVFGVNQISDVFWCTADLGWITGHSYVAYGPLLSGVSQVIFEGIPTYPTASRLWEIIDEYHVTHFYTAPTAIRSLESLGTSWFKNSSLKSLKVLGSVGEPINSEAWHWYDTNVGKNKCPIVDTWWQTETGGIMISALANISDGIPTFATYPLPGVYPALVNDQGEIIKDKQASGNLIITKPWPGIARTIWKDHTRYEQTYFSTYKGNYFTGDGSNRDEEGRYRITGRVDDVLNVSGHRLSTAEIENAINESEAIVESAVVGMPHSIKGQGVFAYVLLKPELKNSTVEELQKSVNQIITQKIGAIAKVDRLVVLTQLPKTRSGKIMRRILRKAVEGEWGSMGDTSTLLNPDVVDEIKKILS